jgi:glycosyltransferase involved in cell wall biosynthesis
LKKPKITIDVGPLLDDQWTGIPIFTRRLIQAVLRDGSLDVRFCCTGKVIPADPVLCAIRSASGCSLRDFIANSPPTELKKMDRGGHLLFPSVKGRHPGTGTEASTVHDLSTLFMPETHEDANVAHHVGNLCNELASDDTVFCVSEATRAALAAAFPSVSSKLTVIHQYVDWPEEFSSLERNLPSLKLGRYAVVVGTIEPRKNLALIINALSAREIARSDIRFIVIGRKGWLVDKFMAELTEKQRERVLFTGFVSEFTKFRLIKGAEFLVYPSLYEGFGIPALEAMSLGKPILAARTSSFPEIVGKAGVYFDPLSIAEFATAYKEIQHPLKLAELAPIAVAQAQKFTWQNMAKPVIQWVSTKSA